MEHCAMRELVTKSTRFAVSIARQIRSEVAGIWT